MSKTFSELFEEFNASAATAKGDQAANLPFLAAQYEVLIHHKASAPEDARTLAVSMLDNTIAWLNVLSKPSYSGGLKDVPVLIHPLLEALALPASLTALPENASDRMADAALLVFKKGETLDSATYADPIDPKIYAANAKIVLDLGKLAASVADRMKAETESRTVSVETQRPVTASKPLQLRTGGQPA